jgi:hypothetical protein
MFKQLFVLLFKLIAASTPTWKQLSERAERDNESFYKSYLFPVVGMIALLSFVGVLMDEAFDVHLLQRVLKCVIRQVLVYGGSFYLVSYVLGEYLFPRFGLPKNRATAEQFTGYGSALIYAIAMIQSLFPSLFLLKILVFYTLYLLWTGAEHFLKVRDSGLIRFTVLAGIVVLLTPFLVERLMGWLMPGMQ